MLTRHHLRLSIFVSVLSIVLCLAPAAWPSVVFYTDGSGGLKGVINPNAYDPKSALSELANPMVDPQTGVLLQSAVLPGTTVLDFRIEGDVVIVDFSRDIVRGRLGEDRLMAIFEQVKATLRQFGLDQSIKLLAEGKLLSDYTPPVRKPAPRPKASASGAPSRGAELTGALTGHSVTVSPGHGIYWNGSGWYTQRPVYCSPLNQEDYHNLEMCQYLETYLLADGMNVKMVRCTNKSYGNHYTGNAWWKMAACYWLQNIGYPCSVYGSDGCNLGSGGSDSTNDIRSRPLSSDYDNTDIYVSLHTNGLSGDCYGSCPTGTETYYDASTEHAPWGAVSQTLANNINGSIMNAINQYIDAGWSCHGTCVKNSNGAYGEIRIPDRAATLTELGFHDSCSYDAVYLRDNFFRSAAMWGMYKGICSYFSTTPTWGFYSCEYVSDNIPTTMDQGVQYPVSIVYRNRGVLWTEAKQIRLGAVGDWDRFTTQTRQYITGDVGPGQTYSFNFTMTAPRSGGTYITDWRMVRDGVTWFGPTVSKEVLVTGPPDTEAPAAPTNLAAQEVSMTQINLTWTAAIDNVEVTGYKIFRDGSGSQIADIAGTLTSYSDTGLAPNSTHTYRVSAYDCVPNESPQSDPATATTMLDSEPPTVPTNLAAEAFSTTQIDLSWTASTDNLQVVGYKVFRDDVQIATVTGGATTYSDTGRSPNTSYTYRVSAYDQLPNESARCAPVTAFTQAVIWQDGFPNLNNWTADVVADGTTRGVIFDDLGSHGTYTGDGSGLATAGSGANNGSFSYRSLTAPFSVGAFDCWHVDQQGNGDSYQGIHVRGFNGSTLVFSAYMGTYPYSPGSTTKYSAGVYDGTTWTWAGQIANRSMLWQNFKILVGASSIKFYINGVLKATLARPANVNTFGFTRVNIGGEYNVKWDGYYDDAQFAAPRAVAPTVGTPTALSTTSIRWNFTDSSTVESAFVLHDAAHAVLGTGARNASYIDEAGLTANAQYTRHLHAKNGTLEGPASASASRYTLSVAPTTGNVTCDRSPSIWYATPGFNFTAVGGFGPGTVQYYRYAWEQSASHTWTGAEPQWSAGGLALTASTEGVWYLHVKGYNGDNVENGTLTLGPYQYDATAPPAPTVTDEGVYTPSTSELIGSWSTTDPGSGVTQYQYAIRITPGGTYVVGWTTTASDTVTHTGLTLSPGTTYYFSAKAQNGAGQWGDAADSDGILVVADTGTIAQAKAVQDSITPVALLDKVVTANFGSYFYIQEEDTPADSEACGIRVEATSPDVGSLVSLAGILQTPARERKITTATLKTGASGTIPPAPLLINRLLGGSSLNSYTPGVTGGVGVNNIGLLVTTTGRITHSEAAFCYIDDGSALQDGSGFTGVRVDRWNVAKAMPEGTYVIVTGIVSAYPIVGNFAPMLIPRGDSDVVP